MDSIFSKEAGTRSAGSGGERLGGSAGLSHGRARARRQGLHRTLRRDLPRRTAPGPGAPGVQPRDPAMGAHVDGQPRAGALPRLERRIPGREDRPRRFVDGTRRPPGALAPDLVEHHGRFRALGELALLRRRKNLADPLGDRLPEAGIVLSFSEKPLFRRPSALFVIPRSEATRNPGRIPRRCRGAGPMPCYPDPTKIAKVLLALFLLTFAGCVTVTLNPSRTKAGGSSESRSSHAPRR